jgi:hypothetical protein
MHAEINANNLENIRSEATRFFRRRKLKLMNGKKNQEKENQICIGTSMTLGRDMNLELM